MSKRLLILLILCFITIAYRGTGIYSFFFSNSITGSDTGIGLDVKGSLLVVNSVREKMPGGAPSPSFRAGLRPGDQILALYNSRGEGKRILSLFDSGSAMHSVHFGEPWTLVIGREGQNGAVLESRVDMPPVPRQAVILWALRLLTNVILPLIVIVTAFFTGFMKPEDDHAFLACLLFLSFSSIFGPEFTTFPRGLREFGLVFSTTLSVSLIYLFMRFFLLFPSPSLIDRKAPWLKHAVSIAFIPVWAADMFGSYAACTSFGLFEKFKNSLPGFGVIVSSFIGVVITIGFASLVLNTVKAGTKDERRRMTILLAGTMAGLLPLVALAVYVGINPSRIPPLWIVGVVVATLGIFPISFVYVVIKHRVLGIRMFVRRGLQYALISRGYRIVAGVVIFLILDLISIEIFQRFLPNASTATVVIYTLFLAAVVSIGMPKINRPVIRAIDRRFFREAYNAQKVLTDLSRAVRQLAAQPDKLLEMVTDQISDSLLADQVAIFLRGAAMRRLPASESSAAGSALKLQPSGNGNYHCEWHRMRAGVHGGTSISLDKARQLTFASTGFVSRTLETMLGEEHEPLEVYFDDPNSWANALIKGRSAAGELYQERELLEQLNTRLIVPLVSNHHSLGFMSLGERLSEEPYSKEDKELLLTVADQTAIALDYAKLIDQVAEQEKLNREIEIAKEVQQQLFPQVLPPMKSLDYTGMCRPARGVGGDYYDFLLLGSGKLGVALGDIAGKGISASLLMASLQALLRSQAPSQGERLDELMLQINRLMWDSTASNRYATFFYGLYDDTRRQLTYVNAGHNPPMIVRACGVETGYSAGSRSVGGPVTSLALPRAAECETIRLESGGPVVGAFPNSLYEQACIQLFPGDVLLVYSDGISEAMTAEEEEFGEARLASLISANLELPATELCDLILQEVDNFVSGSPQYDDMTLVVAKVV
ncbi:MAG: SpoIIE family protein phosphatase [Acidobacteriia bacterium]|nr:SpoIIE family protein phosphatase [Terriglobia bacterium]